jgi:hypothetical protein
MRRQLIPLVVLVVLSAGFAFAQEETTGTLFGRVLDETGAVLPGATVTMASEQGTRTVVTDERGRFLLPYLTPGRYSARVELPGFAPLLQENIEVRLGQRTELVFTLRLGQVTETVTVLESSPTVDVTTTTAGGTLDADVLVRIAVGRQFSDTLYVVPGVSSSGQVGRANPSISGASGLENAYVVDGVNITNAGYGGLGSYSIIFGSLGSGVTYDFIDEIQVKTAGYEAEFGRSTGGVVNIVTKSGTNSYRGSVFGYIQPDALEADWKEVILEDVNDPEGVNTTAVELRDVGFALGGPILKDRAFFFGSVNPQWDTRSLIAPEGYPLRALGDVDRKRLSTSYAAKGTLQVTPNHRIDASFFGDPAEGDEGPQRRISLTREDTAGFSAIDYGGHNQSLRYQGIISENWFIEGSFARATNKIFETPSVDEWSVTDRTVSPSVRTGGIGYYEVGNDGRNKQYQVKSTNLFGTHQLRYGFTFEQINYDNIIDRTGPPITLSDGQRTVTGATITIMPDPVYGKIYRATRGNLTNVRETNQDYLAFFIQDKFDFGERLTVSAGIRYEQQKLAGNLVDFTWKNNWAPRLGAIFDPTGEGRTKIFGNWGRYYAKVPNDLAARAMAADAGLTRADYFDAAMTQPVPEGVEAAGTTRHLLLSGLYASDFDPDSKTTYLDEAVAGFEFEAVPELSFGVRYIYRDMPRVLEDVGTVSLSLYFTNPDIAESVEYFITNPRDGYPATVNGVGAFEKPIHKYHAVEVTADKRFSNNWALIASYRWSRLRGTFEGFFRNDNGQSDPGITSLYDFPTNDPTYSANAAAYGFRGDIRNQGSAGQGPLPNDRTHQLKLNGVYTLDVGLSLGMGLFVSSGQPLTALAANPYYTNDGEIPEGPRGSGFETVDGFKKRTPSQISVNVHADYGFRLGEERRLVLVADIFNLFDTQRVMRYVQDTELEFQVPDPDFGKALEFYDPRQIRLGIRFEF